MFFLDIFSYGPLRLSVLLTWRWYQVPFRHCHLWNIHCAVKVQSLERQVTVFSSTPTSANRSILHSASRFHMLYYLCWVPSAPIPIIHTHAHIYVPDVNEQLMLIWEYDSKNIEKYKQDKMIRKTPQIKKKSIIPTLRENH